MSRDGTPNQHNPLWEHNVAGLWRAVPFKLTPAYTVQVVSWFQVVSGFSLFRVQVVPAFRVQGFGSDTVKVSGQGQEEKTVTSRNAWCDIPVLRYQSQACTILRKGGPTVLNSSSQTLGTWSCQRSDSQTKVSKLNVRILPCFCPFVRNPPTNFVMMVLLNISGVHSCHDQTSCQPFVVPRLANPVRELHFATQHACSCRCLHHFVHRQMVVTRVARGSVAAAVWADSYEWLGNASHVLPTRSWWGEAAKQVEFTLNKLHSAESCGSVMWVSKLHNEQGRAQEEERRWTFGNTVQRS